MSPEASNTAFENAAMLAQQKAGYGQVVLPGLLEKQWAFFVGECAEGYQWDYSEYLNELETRNRIELVYRTAVQSNDLEAVSFTHAVGVSDDAFRSIIHPKIQNERGGHWWEVAVLKIAGELYASYIRDVLQVSIRKVDADIYLIEDR